MSPDHINVILFNPCQLPVGWRLGFWPGLLAHRDGKVGF
jgi:hypothetical protein